MTTHKKKLINALEDTLTALRQFPDQAWGLDLGWLRQETEAILDGLKQNKPPPAGPFEDRDHRP